MLGTILCLWLWPNSRCLNPHQVLRREAEELEPLLCADGLLVPALWEVMSLTAHVLIPEASSAQASEARA